MLAIILAMMLMIFVDDHIDDNGDDDVGDVHDLGDGHADNHADVEDDCEYVGINLVDGTDHYHHHQSYCIAINIAINSIFVIIAQTIKININASIATINTVNIDMAITNIINAALIINMKVANIANTTIINIINHMAITNTIIIVNITTNIIDIIIINFGAVVAEATNRTTNITRESAKIIRNLIDIATIVIINMAIAKVINNMINVIANSLSLRSLFLACSTFSAGALRTLAGAEPA